MLQLSDQGSRVYSLTSWTLQQFTDSPWLMMQIKHGQQMHTQTGRVAAIPIDITNNQLHYYIVCLPLITPLIDFSVPITLQQNKSWRHCFLVPLVTIFLVLTLPPRWMSRSQEVDKNWTISWLLLWETNDQPDVIYLPTWLIGFRIGDLGLPWGAGINQGLADSMLKPTKSSEPHWADWADQVRNVFMVLTET